MMREIHHYQKDEWEVRVFSGLPEEDRESCIESTEMMQMKNRMDTEMVKERFKVKEMDSLTQIKMKTEDETLCYLHYNPHLNVLTVLDSNKNPLRWVPLTPKE